MHPNRHANSNPRFWGTAWTLAILVHAFLFGVIAWFIRPDYLVHVVKMVPSPDETVSLAPAQALRPVLYFSRPPARTTAARLCQLDDTGHEATCFQASPHPEHDDAIQFEPVHTPGQYAIIIEENAFDPPWQLDGEYLGRLPSGDGHGGGIFRASFELTHQPKEILSATVYDKTKPLTNGETASNAVQSRPDKAEPPAPSVSKPPKQKPTKPKPRKPHTEPAPVPSAPQSTPAETVTTPAKLRLTPDMLAISPDTMSPELLQEAAKTAADTFARRDTNAFVAKGEEARQRFIGAYNSSGPTVGIGDQGNNLAHEKDVAEYLARMHKEIHALWAHGYLIRLDTMYRGLDPRLHNPDIEAVMEITLDSLGQVIDVRVVRSSGIMDYDSEAIRVAWNSSPGIAPPKIMLSTTGKAYIHWTFWRDTRQCGVFGVKVFRYNNDRRQSLDFNLKRVQQLEKQLGLPPSTLPSAGTQKPSSSKQPSATLPEKINPLDD